MAIVPEPRGDEPWWAKKTTIYISKSKSTMESGIEHTRKAIDADRDEKYEEALILYEETRQYFLHALKYEICGDDKAQLKASVNEQCDRYLARANELKQYLIKIQKGEPAERPSAINYDEAIEAAKKVTDAGKDKKHKISKNAMEEAIELAKKATDADTDKKYHEAMTLYEHALQYFLHALKYEVHGDKAKATVRKQCDVYLARADQLKQYLKKQKREGGGSQSETKPRAMNKAIEAAKRATDADRDEKYEVAIPFYKEAVQYMTHAILYEINGDSSKTKAKDQCDRYLLRAEELEKYLKKKQEKLLKMKGGSSKSS